MIILILFILCSYFCINKSKEYFTDKSLLNKLQSYKSRLLRQQKDIQKKISYIEKIKDFISNVESDGLQKRFWSSYDVNYEERVSFKELNQLLNQCSNTYGYFFNPISLVLQKASINEKYLKNSSNIINEDVNKMEILLKLQGKFIVKQN